MTGEGETPQAWAIAHLDDVAEVILGQSPPGSSYNTDGDGVPFFQGKAEFGELRPTVAKWTTAPKKRAQADDVLISVRAPVGPTNLASVDCSIGRGLAALRPLCGIAPRYLLYALRESSERLAQRATGTTFPAVSGKQLRSHEIPVAPLPEQHRIVEAIEEQFSRLDAGVESLQRVKRNLARLRASVLQAAVEGRLVPQDPEDEPADTLMEQILRRRRSEWEHLALVRGKADQPGRRRYVEPLAPDARKDARLPEGWCWATWSEIGFSQNGRAFPSKEYATEGVKLLRPGNLHASGNVRWAADNTRFLPERWADENPDLVIGGGELVMNLTAQSLADGFLGRVCLTATEERCLLNQRIARLTPIEVHSRFLLWLLKSPFFRRFVDSLNAGSLIQHMFTSQLDELTLPLPPLAEQQRIVAEVERQFSILDAMEQAIEGGLKRAGGLRQAILREAFAGRLVPQDRSDEPAAALLERIRAERAKA